MVTCGGTMDRQIKSVCPCFIFLKMWCLSNKVLAELSYGYENDGQNSNINDNFYYDSRSLSETT